MFDSIANQMTKQDEGGEAGRELDITEARQALKNLAVILANRYTLAEVAAFLAGYVKTNEA